jgi:hypothetical protein
VTAGACGAEENTPVDGIRPKEPPTRTAASRRGADSGLPARRGQRHPAAAEPMARRALAATRTMIQARASQAFQPARTVAGVKNANVLALDFATSSTLPKGVAYLVHSSAAEASIWFMP